LEGYPVILDPIRTVRFHRSCRAKFADFQNKFEVAVYGTEPITVLCGPFQGTRYFNRIVWGPVTPKWIGSFECELHDVMREVIATDYNVIVDLGAAEGYYAVGLARACPRAQVITYDINFIARRRQRELANLNGLRDRIEIRGRCDAAALERDLAVERSLVISDIEGGEAALMDPTFAPRLYEADVLVECHAVRGVTVDDMASIIARRFEGSHFLEVISSRPRASGEWHSRHPALQKVAAKDLGFALDEFRYPQKWLWMKAK
jgi:hypothetical protein